MSPANTIFMIRPANFGYNPETATSNHFQNLKTRFSLEEVSSKAVAEFNAAVNDLEKAGINVIVFEDTKSPLKPDAIFPNNWVTTHPKHIVIYPMMAKNRRPEIREDIINQIKQQCNITKVIRLDLECQENEFLEGTGSIVFDHINKVAYACRSIRTNENCLKKLCEEIGYNYFLFSAVDQSGHAIYHTNVMMSIAKEYVIICLNAIKDTREKEVLIKRVRESGREVVDINFEQLAHFAGNVLELESNLGHSKLILSNTAMAALRAKELKVITKYSTLVNVDIPSIESFGGGGIRCMMAEVYCRG